MKIRKVEIVNYRGIAKLSWRPTGGVNCLIGPGDSCKSTILEAIDLCLGARRAVKISDADFYMLDVDSPISITLTLGDLDAALLNFDSYGLFLRGFDSKTGEVEDEPMKGLETVLTLNVTIDNDLEPVWSLFSERAAAQNASKNLRWKDRLTLAPSRIGALAGYNLGWRKGSVLNKLTEEKADTASALAAAARQARETFGTDAEKQLKETLWIVKEAAEELGVDIGGVARALLDNYSVNFSGGTVSLHNKDGIPLQNLGVGSLRLLVAGLQRKAAEKSPILLVDEVEYGLEPHRIIRFLASLGAKDAEPPFQVFLTTHSPIVLRELSGEQLHVLRKDVGRHLVKNVGTSSSVQGVIRAVPEAFLARSVVICEGASEVGLIRGLDLYSQEQGEQSIFACGTSLVDAGGANKTPGQAIVFQKLGYRTCVFRDDDKQPCEKAEEAFTAAGGQIFKWNEGEKLESEIFKSVPSEAIVSLVQMAVEAWGSELVDQQLQSASGNTLVLQDLAPAPPVEYNEEQRAVIAVASSGKKNPWFKSVTAMERVGREIVGPYLKTSEEGFRLFVESLMTWARNN